VTNPRACKDCLFSADGEKLILVPGKGFAAWPVQNRVPCLDCRLHPEPITVEDDHWCYQFQRRPVDTPPAP